MLAAWRVPSPRLIASSVLVIESKAVRPSRAISAGSEEISTPAGGGHAMTTGASDTLHTYPRLRGHVAPLSGDYRFGSTTGVPGDCISPGEAISPGDCI